MISDEGNAGLPHATPAVVTGRSLGIDPKLLELLVCPVTRGPLEYDAVRQELVSRAGRLAYPIRDGIPIMLADEARVLPAPEDAG